MTLMQTAGSNAGSNDWMRSLAEHYGAARRRYPRDDLMVVFDIDGTILDMRHMVRRVLLSYDQAHGTAHFEGLCVEDVNVHENQVEPLLERLGVPEESRADVLRWYLAKRWSSEAILASHRPYQGVMDILRWFQLQPRTFVGLNTGRPEAIRRDTLASLNALGREYRVRFADELLHMNPGAWEEGVQDVKVRGLLRFREKGYRVVAAVDNEPSNLAAMSAADGEGEILLLHADTLFESGRREIPRAIAGTSYDITGLARQEDLPRHVQLVWQGVNERGSLAMFLASSVHWGACNLRRDPSGRMQVRRESFAARPWRRGEESVRFEEYLAQYARAGKSLEVELEDDTLVAPLVAALAGVPAERLCLGGSIESLGEDGFRRLARAFPGAALQCPLDFLAPMTLGVPDKAREVLEVFRRWGVSRFSLSWNQPSVRRVFSQLVAWGLEVNLRHVPDLESFLQAALLLPRSLTAGFGQWRGPARRPMADCEAAPGVERRLVSNR